MASATGICRPTTTPSRRSPRWPQGDARRALSTLEIVAAEHLSARAATRTSRVETVAAAGEQQHAPLRQERRGALQRRQRVHQVDARLRSRRGRLLDDAHARGGRRPALRRCGACSSSRARTSATPTRARSWSRAPPTRASPHGDARGHLPAGAGGALPGERAQVERVHRGLARAPRRSIAEHGALPVPMKLRNAVDEADEGARATARATSTRTTSRTASCPGETYLPDELAGEALYEPTDRGEEAAHQGAPRQACVSS